MGQELECKMHYQDRTWDGKAYLESDYVLFRGDQRLKIPFKQIQSVSASDGVMRLEFEGGPAEFHLGDKAEKWVYKILNPPSRMRKLGVKPGMSVRLLGNFEPSFLKELAECKVEKTEIQADLIFYAVWRKAHWRAWAAWPGP